MMNCLGGDLDLVIFRVTLDPFLSVNPAFHPKRNQARQKLATLQAAKYADLCFDICTEIKQKITADKAEKERLNQPLPTPPKLSAAPTGNSRESSENRTTPASNNKTFLMNYSPSKELEDLKTLLKTKDQEIASLKSEFHEVASLLIRIS